MLGPPDILLVDDNPELLALLKKEFSGPHHVRVATNGREAWQNIQDDPPDLLVCDAQIPKTGAALCRRVKMAEDVPSMPAVLLGEPPGGPPASDRLGVDAVVRKPFSVSDLRQCVDRYLPSRTFPEFPNAESPFLEQVLQVVERRLHDPDFAVEALATAMGLSPRHLTRRLQDEADTTPAALIRARRIERAKAYLKTNPATVWKAGEAAGFRSASHFSQVFREAVGVSPSTYRDRHADTP
jgi:AraC-like DNA-binding protein